MGRGRVPWPFVRRSRFVRELQEQGEAYRQNVAAADRAAWDMQRKLRLAEEEFRAIVMTLSGWRDRDTNVFVETAGEVPTHFNVQLVRDYRGLRWTFAYDISDSMMMNMMKTLAPSQAKLVLEVVTEKLVAQALAKMYEQ